MSPTPRKRGGPAGRQPLSIASRRRALATLQAKADAGDVQAAEALVRLSFEREAAKNPPRPAQCAREGGAA